MLDRHHQLTGSFLHDHYSVIAINAIFLTILDGNGTQGMRVADSLQRHAWYADVWLTATARMTCGRADSWEMECHTLCKTTPTWVTARVYLWVCESSDQGTLVCLAKGESSDQGTLGWPPTVLTHCNGTHGMRACWLTATARMTCGRADSLQRHAWYAGAWLTATARTACGRVTHCNDTHDMRARWLMGNGMSYIMQNNTNLSDSPCVPVGVWVIGPRYAWLTSNCTEIGVIGCKLGPCSHYITTSVLQILAYLKKIRAMLHVRNMVCAQTMALSNKHSVFYNFSAAFAMWFYVFLCFYMCLLSVYMFCVLKLPLWCNKW